MNDDHVAAIKSMYQAAIDEVHAGNAVRQCVSLGPSETLVIDGTPVSIAEHGVYVIALGKAALGMCSAVAGILEDRLSAALVVTKDERSDVPASIRVLCGSHPVPDTRSVEAGQEVMSFAKSVPPGALVLCLISGGGSALVEVPRQSVSLDELRDITSLLLRRGASIREINSVRSRLSAIKAGGLLRALAHARVHNIIVSDVLGDDLQSIASGPTVPPVLSIDPAIVLVTYGITADLPDDDTTTATYVPPTVVVANVSLAIDAVARHATSLSFAPFVLTRNISAEAREVGAVVAAILRDAGSGKSSLGPGTCLIAGGESVVTLTGSGVGGRNTEAALSAAIALIGAQSCAVGFLATDGDDGMSGAAGAIVTGQTISVDDEPRARASLRDNDSFTFLNDRNAALVTGSTGTNVNDLIIGIVA
jgi:glycerate 2-kinase